MAEQLPVDIWTLILRHVPQSDRLGSCALVSQKLRAAAAAATDALEVAFGQGEEEMEEEEQEQQQQQQQRAEAFGGYLQHHGSQLTSLKLQQAMRQTLAQLPCSRLLRLELSRGTVQLGPHNGLPGVLGGCAGLTRLDLSNFQVPTGLSGLSVLVNLRDLQVVHVVSKFLVWSLQTPISGWESTALPGSVLPCLTHLTSLHLSGVTFEDVHHVSCLSSLAVLSINCIGSFRLAPDIAPGFVLPASLHDLSLTSRDMRLGPAVFAAAVQLTRLKLAFATVRRQGDVSGGAALLAAVAGLSKLDTLELESLRLAWPAPCAAYQALTASSCLQRLSVLRCQLPAGAFEYVFPPARVYGELQWLDISEVLSARDVSALVGCCPRLQDLQRLPGKAVAALTPLTCLTSLKLNGRFGYAVGDAAGDCVPGLAALTHLRDLDLYLNIKEHELGRAALLPLTALTQLTRCDIHPCRLINQAEPGQPPDVWRQLRQFCLADGDQAAQDP